MTVLCPNGHASTTTDYCDQCGARLEATSEAGVPPQDEPDTAAAATFEPCPRCSTPRSHDDRYCEACGYDFAAGPVDDREDPAAFWEAVVRADRKVVDAGKPARHQPIGIKFPVFISVGSKPVTVVIVPFVGEPNGDSVFTNGPQFL